MRDLEWSCWWGSRVKVRDVCMYKSNTILTNSFGDCVGCIWRGRDGTIQCVGPRIIQAELSCNMAVLDVAYIFFLFFLFPFFMEEGRGRGLKVTCTSVSYLT